MLTAGVRYRFSVVSVNAVGYSVMSIPYGIYAASVPNAPSAPTMISQS